jgi:hypothetical protein
VLVTVRVVTDGAGRVPLGITVAGPVAAELVDMMAAGSWFTVGVPAVPIAAQPEPASASVTASAGAASRDRMPRR